MPLAIAHHEGISHPNDARSPESRGIYTDTLKGKVSF